MTLFKPQVGKVIFTQTTGGLSVIIPKLYSRLDFLNMTSNLGQKDIPLAHANYEDSMYWPFFFIWKVDVQSGLQIFEGRRSPPYSD